MEIKWTGLFKIFARSIIGLPKAKVTLKLINHDHKIFAAFISFSTDLNKILQNTFSKRTALALWRGGIITREVIQAFEYIGAD